MYLLCAIISLFIMIIELNQYLDHIARISSYVSDIRLLSVFIFLGFFIYSIVKHFKKK